MNKFSLIITTYNEAKSIHTWCHSVLGLEVLPNEIVIVDSLSSDETISIIKKVFEKSNIDIRIISEKCNISKGRNIAIKNCSYNNVLITDAGVRLDKYWSKFLLEKLKYSKVVAGYYKYTGTNPVQKAYSDLFYKRSEDVNNFLPSSRSLALKKEVWQSVGGYDERYDIGEDTHFDLLIKEQGYEILFCPEAFVSWDVRDSFKAVFIQQFKYSMWDGLIKQNVAGHIKIFVYYMFICIAPFLFDFGWLISFVLFSVPYIRKVFKDEKRFSYILYKFILATLCPIVKAIGFSYGFIFKRVA
ncbi:glycosyltransferase [Shewanella insulae]|uniref:glycosyltransferase n=1 Tax=Shewanella insulae TaxID=2681496 RepID=UPI00248132AC|nr:glycosyltransferase [Shewanella insulae]